MLQNTHFETPKLKNPPHTLPSFGACGASIRAPLDLSPPNQNPGSASDCGPLTYCTQGATKTQIKPT